MTDEANAEHKADGGGREGEKAARLAKEILDARHETRNALDYYFMEDGYAVTEYEQILARALLPNPTKEALPEEPKPGWVWVPEEALLRWGTAFPVLATMLDRALCFGGAQKAREMQAEISAMLRALKEKG